MVPSAWGIRNELADSQINAGLYEDALIQLDLSLAITGDASQSTRASYLKGRAFQELGRSDEALRALKLGLSIAYSSESSDASFELINTIYTAQGIHVDIDHFDKEISEDPDDAVAYYFRGLAHFTLGSNESAIDDFNESYGLGVQTPKARALRGIANIRTGKIDGPNGEMAQALLSGPSNPLINAYYAEFKLTERNLIAALKYAENSNALDPDLGLGYLIRSKAFLLLGLEESARQVLKLSVGLDFPTSQDYITRGEIFAFLGESEMAFSDINQAIRINPNQSSFYHTRGKVYANMGEFDSALADLNTAIEKDSSVGEFFITRGVVYDILGKPDLSIADFEIGKLLASAAIPRPDQRDVAFFAVYPAISSTDNKANLLLKLQIVREAQLAIENNALVRPSDNNYPFALQVLAESYLELENWVGAADVLSKMIDVSPSTLEAYRFRGEAYSALKQYAEANADFSQALAIDAFDSAIFILRGNTYAEMEEYTLARGDFNAALRWDPDSSDAFAARGYLSVQSGNHSLALPDINRAIELFPLNHDALVKRGNAYIGLGQAELALSDLDQAIIIAPTNSDYLYSRGLLYLGLTEYESALKDFDAAIDLNQILGNIDPRHTKPFIGRGRANLRLGNPSQALDDANRARRILETNFYNSVDWAAYQPTIGIQLADAHDFLGDAYKELGEESKAQSEYQLASDLR
jgi:tetratricopeptide (TPR) repeat protein